MVVFEFNRFEMGFVCNLCELKVYFFLEDCEMMKDFVFCYFNVEMGGDFFGLWIFDGDVVFYMVLGFGKNCKRIVILFY